MTYTNKELHSRAFAHWCYDKNQNFLWFQAWLYQHEYYITEQEKQEALEQREARGKEKAQSIQPNQLVFVGMWSDNDTEIGNFRIRTEIQRGDWRCFFTEISSWHGGIFVDFSIDRDLQYKHETELGKLRIKNWDNRRINRSEIDKKDCTFWMEQPYYNYRIKEAREFLKNKPETKQTVIDFVNYVFDTKFKTMEVVSYLLDTDDYISISN